MSYIKDLKDRFVIDRLESARVLSVSVDDDAALDRYPDPPRRLLVHSVYQTALVLLLLIWLLASSRLI